MALAARAAPRASRASKSRHGSGGRPGQRRTQRTGKLNFLAGDAAALLAGLDHVPDVAFVDPPRAGMTPQAVAALAALGPRRVVYVSCNPATLARDAALLAEGGYALTEARPVDLFPHRPHSICAALLERGGAV
jgi:23S rRNA (uracil1939-C5)-methyltransferase